MYVQYILLEAYIILKSACAGSFLAVTSAGTPIGLSGENHPSATPLALPQPRGSSVTILGYVQAVTGRDYAPRSVRPATTATSLPELIFRGSINDAGGCMDVLVCGNGLSVRHGCLRHQYYLEQARLFTYKDSVSDRHLVSSTKP